MKVKGLDGRDYTIVLKNSSQERGCSSYHKAAIALLKELYPMDAIIEEVSLPGCPSKLYLDILLPLRKKAFEIQGIQHYRFSIFFFKDRRAFAKALGRDRDKRRWCELNNVKLIELKYNEQSSWREIILR